MNLHKEYKLEKNLQKDTMKYIKQRFPNAYVFNVHGGRMQKSGVPDVLACIGGIFVAIELKVGDNTPSEKQEYEIDLIWKADGVADFAWNLNQVSAILDTVENKLNEIHR